MLLAKAAKDGFSSIRWRNGAQSTDAVRRLKWVSALRQAAETLLRWEIRQAATRSRSGMNWPQIENASCMQAPESSARTEAEDNISPKPARIIAARIVIMCLHLAVTLGKPITSRYVRRVCLEKGSGRYQPLPRVTNGRLFRAGRGRLPPLHRRERWRG